MTTSILWSVSLRAICQQGIVQGRTRGSLAPQTETHIARLKTRASIHFQSAAGHPFGSVIAAVSSLCWRKLAGRFERGGPLCTRLPATFSRFDAGTCARDLQFVAGIKSTAGKCFSFLPRVKFLQEPARGIAQTFSFSPVHAEPLFLGLVAVADRHSSSERKIGNVGIRVGEIQNVVR